MRCAIFVLVTIVNSALSETPVGHLKPLGHHKSPSVPVAEFTRENAPRPKEFFEQYVKPSKPALFRGALLDSVAYQKWTDAYIRQNYGEMEVRLEGKKEKKHLPPVGETYLGRDTLRHFVDTYHNEGNNVYVVSDLPLTMYKDMGVVPSFGACGQMAKRIIEIDIWWSGGGSSSIIHKDAFNQMNCLLNGTKYWKLIEYKYEKDIYKFDEGEYQVGGFSRVDPNKVDLVEFPKVSNIEWSNITVYAGDCLFLPKSYYHQVESEGTNNKAVSILFARFDNMDSLNFSDCTENTDYKSLRSLSDFDVMWEWKGKGEMVMGRMDVEEGMKGFLYSIVEDANNAGMDLDENNWKEMMEQHEMVEEISNEILNVFPLLDENGDGVITKEDIRSLGVEKLKKLSDQIEPYEPSNNYNFEYSIISFDRVWAMAKLMLIRFPILKRDIWLNHYVRFGGTRTFGNEIFSGIAGDKSYVTSAEVTDQMLYAALENWVKFWAPQYSGLEEPPLDLSMNKTWLRTGAGELMQKVPNDTPSTDANRPSGGLEQSRDEL